MSSIRNDCEYVFNYKCKSIWSAGVNCIAECLYLDCHTFSLVERLTCHLPIRVWSDGPGGIGKEFPPPLAQALSN